MCVRMGTHSVDRTQDLVLVRQAFSDCANFNSSQLKISKRVLNSDLAMNIEQGRYLAHIVKV